MIHKEWGLNIRIIACPDVHPGWYRSSEGVEKDSVTRSLKGDLVVILGSCQDGSSLTPVCEKLGVALTGSDEKRHTGKSTLGVIDCHMT